MKTRLIFLAAVAMVVFIAFSCYASESAWSAKENGSDGLRLTVGLPSVAIGNLNPSARNPGMELFCTALYDNPGGYCYYFTLGLPFTNYAFGSNVTVTGP